MKVPVCGLGARLHMQVLLLCTALSACMHALSGPGNARMPCPDTPTPIRHPELSESTSQTDLCWHGI